MNVQKYNKAFGALGGAIVGMLVTFGVLPSEFQSPENMAAIITVTSLVGTYFAPKNAQ